MKRWFVIINDKAIQSQFVGVNLKTCVLYLICKDVQVKFMWFSADHYHRAIQGGGIFEAWAVGKSNVKKVSIDYREVPAPAFKPVNTQAKAAVKSKASYNQNIKYAKRRWK